MVGVLGALGLFHPTDCEVCIFVVNFLGRNDDRFEETLCLGQ